MRQAGKQQSWPECDSEAEWALWGPRLRLLWRRRQVWLRYFVRVTGSWADAEDLLSSLVLRVMQDGPGDEAGDELELWLRDTARAVAWNWQRARQRREELVAQMAGQALPWDRYDPELGPGDAGADPANVALRRLDAVALREALARLPRRHRQILAQVAEGLSLRAIARGRRWTLRRAVAALAEARSRLLSQLPAEQATALSAALQPHRPAAARRTRRLVAARTQRPGADHRPDAGS